MVSANAIAIRSYEGDGEDAARLLQSTWVQTYQERMWFPLWDSDFLRWQLGSDRRLSVAAYEGERIVGCFFSAPHSMRLRGVELPMTLCSWFTVDPAYRLPRLAVNLVDALRGRHADTGQALAIGVVSGDRNSIAHRFWAQYARTWPAQFRFMFKFGFWLKVLQPTAGARAGIQWWERLGARLLAPATKTLWRPIRGLRAYEPRDLDACGQLLADATKHFEWTLTWTPDRLAHQLEGGTPRTLVFDRDGRVLALVNYHHASLQGREPMKVAFIDLWAAGGVSGGETPRLVAAVCEHLREEGADAILCLRSALFPAAALLANAFVPLPANDHLVVLFAGPQVDLTPPATWSLLFR